MRTITRDQTTYRFGPDERPVADVQPGETLLFETWDALGGKVHTLEDALMLVLPPEQLNPATGPVRVLGAEPGDLVAATIIDIKLGERGQSRCRAGSGVIIDELCPPRANLIPVRDGIVHFNECIHYPARPMVGVIGTAPAGEASLTFNPGAHGGNMDINDVHVGTTVYLPVAVPGALFAIGDVHASMGDGELTGGGIDIPADITVRLDLVKGAGWRRALLENADAWSTTGNGATLEEAVRIATSDMTTLLARNLDLSREEAFILIGTAGDARIGQAANCGVDVTAYVRISKAILPGVRW
ncbi:MAG: acetamidase/formamidase family protein [Anaerolineae bacterium]